MATSFINPEIVRTLPTGLREDSTLDSVHVRHQQIDAPQFVGTDGQLYGEFPQGEGMPLPLPETSRSVYIDDAKGDVYVQIKNGQYAKNHVAVEQPKPFDFSESTYFSSMPEVSSWLEFATFVAHFATVDGYKTGVYPAYIRRQPYPSTDIQPLQIPFIERDGLQTDSYDYTSSVDFPGMEEVNYEAELDSQAAYILQTFDSNNPECESVNRNGDKVKCVATRNYLKNLAAQWWVVRGANETPFYDRSAQYLLESKPLSDSLDTTSLRDRGVTGSNIAFFLGSSRQAYHTFKAVSFSEYRDGWIRTAPFIGGLITLYQNSTGDYKQQAQDKIQEKLDHSSEDGWQKADLLLMGSALERADVADDFDLHKYAKE